jgi:hypothetical protein
MLKDLRGRKSDDAVVNAVPEIARKYPTGHDDRSAGQRWSPADSGLIDFA